MESPINPQDIQILSELGMMNDMDSLRGVLGSIKGGKASHKEMAYALKLIEEYQKKLSDAGHRKWFLPGTVFSIDNLPKHRAFFKAGKDYRQRVFLASNRTGKTIAGAYETSLHLTGEYPDWWEGRTFNHSIASWAAGQTGQTTRDTLQKELLGPVGAFGTGMIPRHLIGKTWARPGVPNAIDVAEIKNVDGSYSSLGFKSYDQDMKSFYGWTGHTVWLDEECPDLIHNECVMRTMTTDGIIYVTFTPLHGLTQFIVNYSRDCDYLEGALQIHSGTSDDDSE